MDSSTQPSLPLSSGDLEAIMDLILGVAVCSVLYGVDATFFLTAIWVFLTKPPQGLPSTSESPHAQPRSCFPFNLNLSGPQILLLILIILMLSISTGSLILNIQYALLQISTTGYNVDFDAALQLSKNILIGHGFLDRLNFLISDGIVVWRAWIMFSHSLFVRGVLSLCMIGSTVGTFVDAGMLAIRIRRDPTDIGTPNDGLVVNVPLLTTNFISTSFIGYRAW
ncbi:hypothetical protein D9758_004978 [Tetrapyrgos nigripes]|uniref:Uncharacterized protein n=1 Tax=Tetrapyrgos nigripes TaxID=182062 RepID=A0A8H5LWJ6_9AGAR|nr:hypothetical protein D9758_004978 [Tetrapyrgos nigripes]